MIAPLLLGVAFGWLLHKARLGRYDTIVGVFAFRDLTVIRFLFAALAVAAVTAHALVALGASPALPVPRSALVADLIGGVVFGAGMALAGFCPATVAAGAAEGRLDHLVAGTLGLLAGALIYGLAYPYLAPIGHVADLGPVTAARALGVSPWLLLALLVEVAAIVIWIIERAPHRRA